MIADSSLSPRRAWADWPFWPHLLVGVAVLLRCVHIYNSSHNPTFWAPAVDPAWYDHAAQEILRGNWGPFPLFRAPLYPALLAAVYAVFGHSMVAARLLNVVLQALTVWVIYRVGRAYFSPRTGVLAAALFAVNGMAIYFAGEILSVSAEMLASALLMWTTLRLLRSQSPGSLIVCGLSWGLAAITRPNNIFLFPVPVVLLWLAAGKQAASRPTTATRLRTVLLWSLAAFLPILPVTLANLVKGHQFVLVATQGGVNFWIGNNPESTGIVAILPGYGATWTMEDAQNAAEADVGHPLNPGQLSGYYYAKGMSFLAAHPWSAVQFMIRKTLLFFNRFEISNNKHITHFSGLSPWLPPLIYLNFGVLIPLGVLGWWALRRQPDARLLAILTLLYTVSVVLFFITSRFRMPTVPWMAVLAAGGLAWLWDARRGPRTRRLLLPVALLVGGTAVAWMNPWNMQEAPYGWARHMEGNAYLKLGQLDSARAAFLDAIHDTIGVAEAEMSLGVIAGREGRNDDARRWYEASLLSDSANPAVWNNLGTIREAQRDTAGAIAAYLHALSIKPSFDDPRHNLAGIYFRAGVDALKRGRDSVAVRNLEQSCALEPSAVSHYDLAIAYGRGGNTQRALEHLESALDINPRFTPGLELRERLLSGTATFPESSTAP